MNLRSLRRQAQEGFTLMEVLVGIAVIALLAFVLLPAIVNGIKASSKSISDTEITAKLQSFLEEARANPNCAALGELASTNRVVTLSRGETLTFDTTLLSTCQEKSSVNLRVDGFVGVEKVVTHDFTIYITGNGELEITPNPEPPISTTVPYTVNLRCDTAVSDFRINARWSGSNGELVWSDGVIFNGTRADSARNLAANVNYRVAVKAPITSLVMEANGASCYRSVAVWGSMRPTQMTNAFLNAVNLTTVPNTNFTGNVEQMAAAFSGATSFNANISSWDVSKVKSFSIMFDGATSFNNGAAPGSIGPALNWSTPAATSMASMFKDAKSFNASLIFNDSSNVTTMVNMFQRAESFNNGSGGTLRLNTSSVTNMGYMFDGASSFNASVSRISSSSPGFDTSNVTNMSAMFRNATAFNNGSYTTLTFDTSKVTSMASMFEDATSFNRSVSGFDTSNVTTMSFMFKGAASFNNGLSNSMNYNSSTGTWDTSKVTTMSNMFRGASSFNRTLKDWRVSNVAYFTQMFQEATSFNQQLTSWNTGSATHMSSMFYGATGFNNGQAASGRTSSLPWNTSNVTTMANMFFGATIFNQRLGSSTMNWDTSKVEHFSHMFYNAAAFNNGQAAGSYMSPAPATCVNSPITTSTGAPLTWDTSSALTMNSMFYGAVSYNQLLNGWKTSSLTSLANMFYDATSFNNGKAPGVGGCLVFDTSQVTNMESAFQRAAAFNQQVTSSSTNWDVSKVTNFNYTFDQAIRFNNGNAYGASGGSMNWNTSSATSMVRTFWLAYGFNQKLDWDVSKVQNFYGMFRGAYSFNNGEARGMSTSPLQWATPSAVTMSAMFNGSYEPRSTEFLLPPDGREFGPTSFNQTLPNFDTSKVTTMRTMFYKSQFNQPLNHFDTSNVLSMWGMFEAPDPEMGENGTSPFNQDISMWNVSNVVDMERMFAGTGSFNQNISNWNTSKVTTMESMFQYNNAFNVGGAGLKLRTDNVTNLSKMFYNAKNFNHSLVMTGGGWNTSKVTTMESMFQGAEKFNRSLAGLNTSSLTNWSNYRTGSGISTTVNTNWLRVGGVAR